MNTDNSVESTVTETEDLEGYLSDGAGGVLGVSTYPHRYMCSALEELRALLKVTDSRNVDRNIMLLNSLIEEVQIHGNRMEAALEYGSDIHTLHDKRKKLADRTRKAYRKLKALNAQIQAKSPQGEE